MSIFCSGCWGRPKRGTTAIPCDCRESFQSSPRLIPPKDTKSFDARSVASISPTGIFPCPVSSSLKAINPTSRISNSFWRRTIVFVLVRGCAGSAYSNRSHSPSPCMDLPQEQQDQGAVPEFLVAVLDPWIFHRKLLEQVRNTRAASVAEYVRGRKESKSHLRLSIPITNPGFPF